MNTLQIRQLPEDVYQALSLRADREHRRLAQQAIIKWRQVPELLAREKRLRTLGRIIADLESPGSDMHQAPDVLVREDRDR